MKKILITGAAGFVGYHLANDIAEEGHALTVVDNFTLGKSDQAFKDLCSLPNVTFIEADLTDLRSWDKLGRGFDQVYHLAAINSTKLFYEIPYEVLRTALLMNLNAVEWFKQHHAGGKIMFTSSNEAYAGALESFNQLPIPTPEDVPLVISDPYNPRWSYGASKLIGEMLFIHYAEKHQFRMSIVRPHNFYGPRSGYHVIPDVLRRIEQREDPFLLFGPNETRSFCYIDDAVEAMRLVMESTKTDGKTYHIGSPVETQIKDLIHMLFELTGWTPKSIIEKASPAGSVKRRLPHVARIQEDVGWSASTKLESGLQKTIASFSKNPYGTKAIHI